MTLDSPETSPIRKGDRTKRRILDGAIEVLARHGVDGTTHRAVAQAAGVSLSTTSYHFASLVDLMLQAFDLIVNDWNRETEEALAIGRERLIASGLRPDSPPALRQAICDELVAMTVAFMYGMGPDRKTRLTAELRLVFEANHIPQLQRRLDQYRMGLVRQLRLLPELAGSPAPDLDAAILFDAIQTMQFRALFRPHEATREVLSARARRHFGWILGC